MIGGVHAMFYTSEPEALRSFIRDKLGFPAFDVGDGWSTQFRLPEDFDVELYEPRYARR